MSKYHIKYSPVVVEMQVLELLVVNNDVVRYLDVTKPEFYEMKL